jgi:VWFA-related protein
MQQPTSMKQLSKIATLSILLLLIPVAGAWAQSKEKEDELPTFKSQVNVVNLFFNVKDKHGALVPNLKKDDFQVFEDGKPQTVKYFTAETNQPLTLGIMIDSSASQERVLEYEKEAGYEFLKQVLKDKDMAFVISFDVNVDLLQDFTNDNKLLKSALNRARINTGGGGGGLPGMGGGPFPTSSVPKGTLLYDAIYLGAHDKLATEVGRKAMIILTDGEDQGSQLRVKDAIESAQKADAICYVILIADRGFYAGGYGGDKAMKELANNTGGRVIEVSNKPEKLRKAFDEISSELRSQYSIGYTPTNPKLDGTFRRVEVRTKDGLKIQTRSGYYAIKNETGD